MNNHKNLSGDSLYWNDFVKNMSLREKIGQMIMAYFSINDSLDDMKDFVHTGIGGIFPGYYYVADSGMKTIQKDLKELQEEARIPLFMCCDMETGAGQYCHDGSCTEIPGLMAFGACNDDERAGMLAYETGRIIAEEAERLGINITPTPVVDVNTNPYNPITNIRAAGDDAESVSKTTIPMIKGIQEGKRLIAMAKHFPGAGMHNRDSHFDLEIMQVNQEQMENVHLIPFMRAIDAGVGCIMTNHAIYPMYDGEYPVTLSKKIVTNLLRDKLGYKGLIMTDAMGMKGITSKYGAEEAAILAIEAGNDIILAPEEQGKVLEVIEKAVIDGRLSEERIEQSVERILKAKQWLGLFEKKHNVNEITHISQRLEIVEKTAWESITQVRDDLGLIPMVGDNKRCLVLEPLHPNRILNIGLHINTTNLYGVLKERCNNIDFEALPIDPDDYDIERVIKVAEGYDVILVGTSFRSYSGQVGLLTQSQVNLLKKVCEVNRRVIFIVSNPYVIAELPFAGTILVNYSTARVSVEATLDVIFGREKARGKLPVAVPEYIDPARVEIIAHS